MAEAAAVLLIKAKLRASEAKTGPLARAKRRPMASGWVGEVPPPPLGAWTSWVQLDWSSLVVNTEPVTALHFTLTPQHFISSEIFLI